MLKTVVPAWNPDYQAAGADASQPIVQHSPSLGSANLKAKPAPVLATGFGRG